MNEADIQKLTDYWTRETNYLNEKVDDAFKQAQDHAYDLGWQRGMAFAERLATDALTSLAGIVCTPVEGYMKAPQCLGSDIRELRKLAEKYRNLLESALPHIECSNHEQDALITAIGNALAESV